MITAVILGLLVGVLSSGTGLGGGFLVVPLLIAMGKDVKIAVGTSFIFILFTAISALIAHFKVSRLDWEMGIALAVGGVLGAQLGPMLLQQAPDNLFKRIFSVMLIGTGIWLFASTTKG
ncbi:MAG: hypothetical protein COV66_04355 [Nitrospinae bacterium CG11_big_fil_rev_8_21_14_0_20_45_15]|nr:MAG: hypothetical protein COV66_04355 [Nitrospinae bacterium CG11_big_fil_rev_8_21_14_0_20_45_15]